MKFQIHKLAAKIIVIISATISAKAQISINSISGTYSQNFDSLPSLHHSDPVWTDNETLPGWYLHAGSDLLAEVTNLRVTQISSSGTDRAHISYGNTDDRALGMQAGSSHRYSDGSASSGSRFGSISVALKNNTGGALERFSFSYTGEQWHITSNRTGFDTLDVEYAIGSGETPYSELTWEALPAASFTAPRDSTTPDNVPFDGNLDANRVTNNNAIVEGVNWQADEILWIRWSTLNYSGSDSGLAIDDFFFNPDPSRVTFQSWIARFPDVPSDLREPFVDASGNGQDNVLNFILNGDPSDPTNYGLQAIWKEDAGGTDIFFTIAVPRDTEFTASSNGGQIATIDGFDLIVEGSGNLTDFSLTVSSQGAANFLPASGLPTLEGSDWEYHTFKTLDATPRAFVRLRASK